MDENIIQTVYETLDSRTDEIIGMANQVNELDSKIKSGRYSQMTITNELQPKMDELRTARNKACQSALDEARNAIAQYRADNAELNKLNPSELTDDVKLLQSGIVLKPRDIEGMLKRNEGNRTMTQIILRYAQENKIDTGHNYFVGGQQEEETARSLDSIIYYYKNWIDKPNAKEMLNKFFGVQ